MDSTMEKFMNLMQEGTVNNYCQAFESLVGKITIPEDFSEDYLIYLFISGLKPEISEVLKPHHNIGKSLKLKDAILRAEIQEVILNLDSIKWDQYRTTKTGVATMDRNQSYDNEISKFDEIEGINVDEISATNSRFNDSLETIEVSNPILQQEDNCMVILDVENDDDVKKYDNNNDTTVINQEKMGVVSQDQGIELVVPKVFDEMPSRFENEIDSYVHKTIEDESIQDGCREDKLYGEMSKGVGNVNLETIDEIIVGSDQTNGLGIISRDEILEREKDGDVSELEKGIKEIVSEMPGSVMSEIVVRNKKGSVKEVVIQIAMQEVYSYNKDSEGLINVIERSWPRVTEKGNEQDQKKIKKGYVLMVSCQTKLKDLNIQVVKSPIHWLDNLMFKYKKKGARRWLVKWKRKNNIKHFKELQGLQLKRPLTRLQSNAINKKMAGKIIEFLYAQTTIGITGVGIVRTRKSTINESIFTRNPLSITKFPWAEASTGSIIFIEALTNEVHRSRGETLIRDTICLIKEIQFTSAPLTALMVGASLGSTKRLLLPEIKRKETDALKELEETQTSCYIIDFVMASNMKEVSPSFNHSVLIITKSPKVIDLMVIDNLEIEADVAYLLWFSHESYVIDKALLRKEKIRGYIWHKWKSKILEKDQTKCGVDFMVFTSILGCYIRPHVAGLLVSKMKRLLVSTPWLKLADRWAYSDVRAKERSSSVLFNYHLEDVDHYEGRFSIKTVKRFFSTVKKWSKNPNLTMYIDDADKCDPCTVVEYVDDFYVVLVEEWFFLFKLWSNIGHLQQTNGIVSYAISTASMDDFQGLEFQPLADLNKKRRFGFDSLD